MCLSSIQAQETKCGKSSEYTNQLFTKLIGEVGNYYYTISRQEFKYYINKCSLETMLILESQEIENDIPFNEKTVIWDCIKIDGKIVFLLVMTESKEISDPNRIYAKTIVTKEGSLNADSKLIYIGDWQTPELDNRKEYLFSVKDPNAPGVGGNAPYLINDIFWVRVMHHIKMGFYNKNPMRRVIHIKTSDQTTEAQSILLYAYVKKGNADKLVTFVILDNNLNKKDEQVYVLNENYRAEMLKPIMDNEGNFYMFPSAIMAMNDEDIEKIKFDSYYYYDSNSKKITEEKLPFERLKNIYKPYNINDLKMTVDGNVISGGFYELENSKDFHSHYFESKAAGLYYVKINKKKILSFDHIPFNDAIFPTKHIAQKNKTKDFAVFYDLHLLNNYAVVTKKMSGLTYEGYKPNRPGDESSEGYEENAIFSIKDGSIQYFTSYESKVFNNGYHNTYLRTYKQIHFVENENKIYSLYTATNENENLKFFNKTNKKDWGLILNTFNLSTKESQCKLLYDIKMTDEKQLPDYLFQLQSKDWIIWQINNAHTVPVKVVFENKQ